MAPSILHRALSFSNVPVHRLDVSPLKEASAASSRHEGLALLTTIAEDTGSWNPSPLLPSHLALEKRLISKILVLREALDLPCRNSCDALDQLLLDTLEALKITYPKCLSGLSGNHTSSELQGLVHLHKVLMSVQERSQLSNLGFEEQTIIESESLDRVGEHVAMILDQVIPVAKEIFSFMESSTSTKAAAAAASVRPEKRSLPPVLSRTRSLVHRGSAGHHPSDSAEVATPCQDGAMRHRKQLKIQKPVPRQEADEGGCTGEGGQTSRRDPPSTPTGDSVLLQSTPSSMSPHPLSAPPPSPTPLLGMPMLLQSWEAMQQDDNASPAVASTPDAQPAKVAAPTAQQHTVDVDASAISASMEAGQPSSSSSMDGIAAVPSVPPPPPVHGDRVQGGPSTDKPAEVVASASSPPQGGPPGNVSRAPPPPPPGNISAALRAKKAGKLKRSTQMGTLYRHLRDRVEGPCAHGGKRQTGNKPRTPGGSKSEAGQGMADALAEMTKRSAYFRQIEEDAENHAAAILELKDAIGSFESRDMAELVRFHQHVDQQLVCLTDETQVLARFEGFPSKKLESLRMAAALYSKLDGTVSKLKGWKLAAPLSNQLDRVEGYFNKIKDDVDMIERNKDEEPKRFLSHNIHFDFGVLVRIKECMVDLSSNCVELALKESKRAWETSAQSPGASPQAAAPSKMLWRVFQLAFRVYNFAGGQDERADRLTATLAHEIEAHHPL
ncbi:hypothetical protein C2845_PM11G22600 [Panicum miliaceum]|uniref:Hydroxyproline-rich glycoprotein family protein n=1 Tax=Panicum miliaceum TaxID=4540 RepID=A0A3L6RQN9_PANMI|nr:hypothetical protein C2845_PM11G22600 [Panicum miliaceum]